MGTRASGHDVTDITEEAAYTALSEDERVGQARRVIASRNPQEAGIGLGQPLLSLYPHP